MQAKEKDKTNFKGIPKRFLSLSSIRRGKKGANDGIILFNASQEVEETTSRKTVLNTDHIPDFTDISKTDLEASVSLDLQSEIDKCLESGSYDETLAIIKNSSLLNEKNVTKDNVTDTNLHRTPSSHIVGPGLPPNQAQNEHLPSPQIHHLELGDFMNTSRDSGIDCSALNSEKNSPEQFIAFTRREAERLRQEQLQYMNSSILETLNENDKSSNEESESDSVSVIAVGNQKLDLSEQFTCDISEQKTPGKLSTTVEQVSVSENDVTITNESIEHENDSKDNFEGTCTEHVTYSLEKNKTEAKSIEESDTFSDHSKDTTDNNHVGEDISEHYEIADPCSPKSAKDNMDHFLFNSSENKTDERKSAEARIQQETEDIKIECPHLIVSPVAVRTAVMAEHKVLPPTPPPASLYTNENSAFAKCKSIKRSVSDVGKGILGRFRHKKKDSAGTRSRDSSVEDGLKNEAKKFIEARSKKSKKLKHKSIAKELNETVLKNDLESNKSMVGLNSDKVYHKKNKQPVTKEKANANSSFLSRSFRDRSRKKQKSTIVKEVLEEFDKQTFEKVCLSKSSKSFLKNESPETIEDLTNSITEMTSRLCASASSAESIQCICDCKNKAKDQECCDKRKTPSPPQECIERSSPDLRGSGQQVELACDTFTVQDRHSPGNESSLYHDMSNFEQASALFDTSRNRMSDNFDTESDTEDDTYSSESYNDASLNGRSIYSTGSSSESDDEKLRLKQRNERRNLGDGIESTDCDTNDSSSSSLDSESVRYSSYSHSSKRINISVSKESARNLEHSSRSLNPAKSSHFSDRNVSSSAFSPESTHDWTDNSPNSVSFHDFEQSPSAYKEFDHINGDVMYVGNDSAIFQDSFFAEVCDSPSYSSPRAKLPSETPASSPLSANSTPVSINVNHINHSVLSQACRRKDSYTEYSNLNQSGLNQSVIKENLNISRGRMQDSPLSRYSYPQKNSNFKRSYSHNENILKTNYSKSEVNLSKSRLNRSNSSVASPVSRSYSHSNSSFIREQSNQTRSSGLNSSVHLQKRLQSSFVDHDGSYMDLNDSQSEFDTSCVRADQSYRSAGIDPRWRSRNGSFYHPSDFYESFHQSAHIKNRQNRSFSDLNEINERKKSHSQSLSKSFCGFNESFSNVNSSFRNGNKSITRQGRSKSLNHTYAGGEVMSTPPLDLSMTTMKKEQKRLNQWVGQMYSPADRTLHKNRGVSESDLCRQILDLYVSDAEESGFEIPSHETSKKKDSCRSKPLLSSSPELKFGKYVAPRNVVKETNVDDFTTTVVKKCYQGKARTRKLQDESFNRSHADDDDGNNDPGLDSSISFLSSTVDHSLLDIHDDTDIKNQDISQTSQKNGEEDLCKDKMNNSRSERKMRSEKTSKSRHRQALKDRTNVQLSSLKLPPSIGNGVDPDSLLQEAEEEERALLKCEKSFDRLTQLYTVHNGQRKVRCLTMNESQNVIKHYPPPKEASHVSWGETLEELDLYRHTPRKTPIKTKPILTQKENSFPYDDDTPSPIVLTKMRKPKPLSKRYKNWPWY